MTVELSRRDALAALAVVGAGLGTGVAVLDQRDDSADRTGEQTGHPEDHRGRLDDHERETLVAIARVVYPSAVEGIEAFVTAYVDGRADRKAFVEGVSTAVADLDTLGQDWYDGRFVSLRPADQDRLLHEVGTDTAEADPDGSTAERVRYFLVNELLFALYASPTGGRLVGIENPQGHPGGLDGYQRGPDP